MKEEQSKWFENEIPNLSNDLKIGWGFMGLLSGVFVTFFAVFSNHPPEIE
jgi:hypothetical protein|tara:strand:- start:881 stop:1030 length:150 start_codon:yes stop_codon:yes gene_type:complete